LNGWFFNLILFLKPTNDELIDLQDYIFLALGTNHSKSINISLTFIKNIYLNKQFETKKIIEISDQLLSSKYKSIVKSTLIILDRIAKNDSSLHNDVTISATIALMFLDEDIQLKTINIIEKYGDTKSEILFKKINDYGNDLFSSAKNKLEKLNFQIHQKNVLINNYYIDVPKISSKNKIYLLNTFDELVFFYSQVFENNEIYHFDLFTTYFQELNNSINRKNISKFEAAFQRACKILEKDLSNGKIGLIENIMAIFFINYFTILISKYPNETLTIRKIYEKYFGEFTFNKNKYEASNQIDISSLIPKGNIYNNYISLLELVDDILNEDMKIPILSTPTHSPCWIDGKVLIKKLSFYENYSVNITDFQLAIFRLVIEKNNDIVLLINKKLNEEIKEIFLYLYDIKSRNEISIKTPELWIPALMRKKDHLSKKYLNNIVKKYNLHLSPYSAIQTNDEKRFLTLCPFNPEIILKKYIKINFKYFNYSSAWNTKNIINTLSILYELWDDYNKSAYLYLAYSFLHTDKTIRNLAVEIWIKYTGIEKINDELLGIILGKLVKKEIAPLKRFTDLIISSMLSISKNHNTNLEIIVNNIILQMNDIPIKGTKKLLVIYKEL
jgi:hypothetical protein